MKLLMYEILPSNVDPYRVSVIITQEMIEWIDEHEGHGRVWSGGHGFYFEREDDAVWFKLRWL